MNPDRHGWTQNNAGQERVFPALYQRESAPIGVHLCSLLSPARSLALARERFPPRGRCAASHDPVLQPGYWLRLHVGSAAVKLAPARPPERQSGRPRPARFLGEHNTDGSSVSGFRVDFLGIGAEKAASDWIAACLREHPEVSFAKYKEVAFFSDVDQHLLKVPMRQYERGLGWYAKQFPPCAPGQVRGEYTPTYMYSQVVAQRIHRHFPNVKLIVCLRDPVKRAFSQYIHDRRIGLIGNISFEQALDRHDSYVQKGLYYKHLNHFYELFPATNIFVRLTDDIEADRQAVLRDLYTFLGLKDTAFLPPSLNSRPNAASTAKLPWLNYLLIHGEYALRRDGLYPILNLLEDLGLRRAAVSFGCFSNRKPMAQYPSMREDTRERLRREFQDDVQRLEGLLGRDLSHWK